MCAKHDFDPARRRVVRTVESGRVAATMRTRHQADVAPDSSATTGELGLEFIPLGWAACDPALDRGVYFRTLFQRFVETLKSEDCQRFAQPLGPAQPHPPLQTNFPKRQRFAEWMKTNSTSNCESF